MEKLKIISAILAISGLINFQLKAQEINDKGVHFENGLTWQQIQDKAKAEHKYIFVDCYATWCVPCKTMDNEVYNQPEVGSIYNKNFVSVRVQMDKTNFDDEQTKNWYATIAMLKKNYSINAYPTLLFFDLDSKPVHKITGALEVQNFIRLATDVRDTNKQYYNVLHNFKPGVLDTSEEKGLIALLKTTDRALAGRIAADYLSRIPNKRLDEFENCKLMVQFQDNLEIMDIALKFIQTRKTETIIAFICGLDKQPKVRRWVIDYISKLDKAEMGGSTNQQLIVQFQNEPQILATAINYIQSALPNVQLSFISSLSKQSLIEEIITNYVQGLSKRNFGYALNLKLAVQFLSYAGVKKAAVLYVKELDRKEIGLDNNLNLISSLRNNAVVQDIAVNYIGQLRNSQVYSKSMLIFIAKFTKMPSDKGFNIFYHHLAQVNKIMRNNNFARDKVISVLLNVEFDPLFATAKQINKEPDWNQLRKTVTKEFDKDYAEMVIICAKENWYDYLVEEKQQTQYQQQYLTANIAKIQCLRDDTVGNYGYDFRLNYISFQIFLHSDDKNQIQTALKWMKMVIDRKPDLEWRDTYACLLYKAGKTIEALFQEEACLQLSSDKQNKRMIDQCVMTIDKIKKGEAIWVEKEYQ